ncbi:hypothetical protein ASPSYDRAFT_51471 [Aspergillus sydowii CBS 593.65]|uniref:Uncharacterized protein n=1 Tax=Aspergillus sydowii CBS 593.65 TaxID=1036612 RepID=A0A1L9T046_9EURO|nr:uncharacterized protein ASPSYDRAFT_51471 [Aspergillus sydowii CBS 593.65]OJJ52789.1 hypothetical protein ASPSYDRAFT_51471 [Aspergillus sydowii CBS 593.65]
MGVTRHSSLVSLVAVRPCSAAAHDHGCGIGILARLRAIRFPEAASLRSQLRPKEKELEKLRHETCRRRLGTPRDEQDMNHKNHVWVNWVRIKDYVRLMYSNRRRESTWETIEVAN